MWKVMQYFGTGGAAGKESNNGKPGIAPLGDMWTFNITSQTWEQFDVEGDQFCPD